MTVSVVITIFSVLLGGGFVASLVQIYRAKPERDGVLITNAQSASVMLKGVNEALLADLERIRKERDSESIEARSWEMYAGVLEAHMRQANLPVPLDSRPT